MVSLRAGDDARYEFLSAWLSARIERLPSELELFRELTVCEEPMIDCGNGVCDLPENCGYECKPPQLCPVIEDYSVGM